MSRIGKLPIEIPQGVKFEIKDNVAKVTGPKGELEKEFHPKVKIEQKENEIIVSVKNPSNKEEAALWGLTRSLVANLVQGVTVGFEKKLEVNGVGYKAEVTGDTLVLNIGYSHPVEYKIKPTIKVEVEKNVITISGIDKQMVGQVAAEIRSTRRPEPYKGKGIKYIDEIIRRKVGKTAAKGSE
ncbi:50S ribosomal protein L6 [Patescibacteria group bacterium]|nr:50S ribosomal protein L6 [Patescibacteria group bacterium]